MKTQPIVWTIAGSDNSAGAGIQADLKTIHGLGAYGCTVITSLTAQNSSGVSLVEPASLQAISAQISALMQELPPTSMKLGMLHSAEIARTVAQAIGNGTGKQPCFIVLDPVLVATSGSSLSREGCVQAIRDQILPLAGLVTPNIPEAHSLVGREPRSVAEVEEESLDAYIEELAAEVLSLGAQAVLLKGGHRKGEYSQDYFTDGREMVWFTSKKRNTKNVHGTGCTLSSAIAACVARGYSVLDAVTIAKMYVNQGLRLAPRLGVGQGPLAHLGWPECEEDFPWVSESARAGRCRPEFSRHDKPGFYPIVNRAEWVEKLAALGVKTAQLRIKDLFGDELNREVERAVATARAHGLALYVNDYWELAIQFGSFGVHLGQGDLAHADLGQMQRSGLHLGVSTHCYYEVARALSVRPSYLAIGPIFPTTTKVMQFAPQGLENLRRWRRTLNYPLVAIGGISVASASEVLDAGADSISVVRDISQAHDLNERVEKWLHNCDFMTPRSVGLSGATTGGGIAGKKEESTGVSPASGPRPALRSDQQPQAVDHS